MSDLYSELIIKRKSPLTEQVIKSLMIAATAALGFLYLMTIKWTFLIALVIMAAADYFFIPGFNLEYEYLYVNGELDIDKIMAKSRRKKVCSLDMKNLECMAPLQSHTLDSYKNNKNIKIADYSSGVKNERQYGMVMKDDHGLSMVIIEPDSVILNDIKRIAPRKVSTM